MGRYINLDDLVSKYSQLQQVATVDINSYHIAYAENQLDGLMSGYFTVPFSDNNITARDLALDFAYLSAGNIKDEEFDRMEKRVMERIRRIQQGKEVMIVTSGSGDNVVSVGETIWSSTQDYHPVFGMGDTPDFVVDSSQVDDEYNERF